MPDTNKTPTTGQASRQAPAASQSATAKGAEREQATKSFLDDSYSHLPSQTDINKMPAAKEKDDAQKLHAIAGEDEHSASVRSATPEEAANAASLGKSALTSEWAKAQVQKNNLGKLDLAALDAFAKDYTVAGKVVPPEVGEQRSEAERGRMESRVAAVQAAHPELAGKTIYNAPRYADAQSVTTDMQYAATDAIGEKPSRDLFAKESKLSDQTLDTIANMPKGQGKALFTMAASPGGIVPVNFPAGQPESGLNTATKSLGGKWSMAANADLTPYFGASYAACACDPKQSAALTESLSKAGINVVEGKTANGQQNLYVTADELKGMTGEKLGLAQAIGMTMAPPQPTSTAPSTAAAPPATRQDKTFQAGL